VGPTALGEVAEYDLWVETPGTPGTPGTPRASVSGRERTGSQRFLIGTLNGDQLRLVTLSGLSGADTAAVFAALVAGDTIRGEYAQRFDTDGPRVLVRRARDRD